MALWLFLVGRADVIAPPGGTCTCKHSQGVIVSMMRDSNVYTHLYLSIHVALCCCPLRTARGPQLLIEPVVCGHVDGL